MDTGVVARLMLLDCLDDVVANGCCGLVDVSIIARFEQFGLERGARRREV